LETDPGRVRNGPAFLSPSYSEVLAKTATFQKFPVIIDMIGISECVFARGAALQDI
jgi:hypothetical protein